MAPRFSRSASLLAGCAGAGSAAKDRPELSFGPEADVGASARPDRGSRPARRRSCTWASSTTTRSTIAIQARVLEALLAAGSRPALAFEMIPETRPGGARGGGPERRGPRRGRPAARLVRPGLARLRDVLAALRAGAEAPAARRRHGSGPGASPGGSAAAASRAAGARSRAAPLGSARTISARDRGDRAAAPGGALRSDQRGPRDPDARELVRAQRGHRAPRERRARSSRPRSS